MTYQDGVIAAQEEIKNFGVDFELIVAFNEQPDFFLKVTEGTIMGAYPEFTKGYMATMIEASEK